MEKMAILTVYTDCRNEDILAIFAVSPFAHINLHTALKVDIGKGKINRLLQFSTRPGLKNCYKNEEK